MPENQNSIGRFARRVAIATLVVAGIALILYLLFRYIETLLIIFIGILLAILLNGLASWLSRRLPIPYGWALTVVILTILGLAVAIIAFAGPRLVDQVDQLVSRIPKAVQDIQGYLNRYELGQKILDQIPKTSDIVRSGARRLLSVPAALTSIFGVLANAVLILFIAIYLAASPSLYRNSLLHLFPQDHRPRVRDVLSTLNRVLLRFFAGQFTSMAVVGLLAGTGFWIAGVPLPFSLGLIAGLFEFVPYLGPILALVPALLLGFAQGPTTALWVLVVYLIVQMAESYLVTPLIQRKAVSIPPAALISIQLLLGSIFGIIGIFLATPIAVIVIVTIQMLYVRGVLDDQVPILGHE